jgi:hypothetical protein
MARALIVVIRPLVLSLIAIVCLVAIVSVVSLGIAWIRKGGPELDLGAVWRHMRPFVFSGLATLTLFSFGKWGLSMWRLRRKLASSGTSLKEFSSWPEKVRSDWLKDTTAPRIG